MSLRTWLYKELTKPSTPLHGLIQGRAYPKKSMVTSVEEYPFIVYKLGFNSNSELAETEGIDRQYFQIYIHDYEDTTVADYGKIDAIRQALKDQLHNARSAEDGVLIVNYLETSQDYSDQTLHSVVRYIRFFAYCKD